MKQVTIRKIRKDQTTGPKRSFGLSRRRLATLQPKVAAGQFPNPFNSGFYRFLVEALVGLGTNQAHPRKAVIAAFRGLTNAARTHRNGATLWKRWKTKSATKTWGERFDLNVEVLQRVPRAGMKNNTPYGLKLIDVGTQLLGTRGVVIDILRGKGGRKYFRINTDSATPLNNFRNRQENSRKAQVARFREARVLAQAGMCAICQRKRRRLCVDHCHEHGHLRGLLCNRCNSGVGFFSDSPPLMLRAALYLIANEKPGAHQPNTEEEQ